MKHVLYLLLNFAIGISLFYFFYHQSQDYIEAISTIQCLQGQKSSNKFCAQCISREKQQVLNKQKAFLIEGNQSYSVLKLKHSQGQLACNQYLQLPNYEKSDKGKFPIELQNLQSTTSIIKQLEGEWSSLSSGVSIIQSEYNQIVIYRWFAQTEDKKTYAKIADSAQVDRFQSILAYFVNINIALFIFLYLYKKSTFSHLKPKIIVFILIFLIALDGIAFDIAPQQSINLARIIILSIFLMRIQSENIIVGLAFIVGYTATSFPLAYLIYLILTLSFIFVKGLNEQNTNEIWIYILVSLFIYIADHVVWYCMFIELADNACIFIELFFLMVTPIGLTLIKDAKYVGFDIYKPADHKRHAISLSGYEEEEYEEDGEGQI